MRKVNKKGGLLKIFSISNDTVISNLDNTNKFSNEESVELF